MHLAEREAHWAWPEDAPSQSGPQALLNHLRFVALGCRAKARTDMFEACALLSLDKGQSLRAHSEALVRCLAEALSKQVIFFRPGTDERSFDEAWLMQLASALDQGDEASARFLLRSRVSAEHHRHMRFLLGRISERLSIT